MSIVLRNKIKELEDSRKAHLKGAINLAEQLKKLQKDVEQVQYDLSLKAEDSTYPAATLALEEAVGMIGEIIDWECDNAAS